MIALLRFLADSCDGTAGVSCLHFRTGKSGRGVLALLQLAVWREVYDIGILEVIHGCIYDPVASLVSYT